MSYEYEENEYDEKKLKFLKRQILQEEKSNIVAKKDSDQMVKDIRKLIEKVVDAN